MRFFDAHNHLHDPRLRPHLSDILHDLTREPIEGMVINGTHQSDWAAVVELSNEVNGAIPAFGLHPWFLSHLTEGWRDDLQKKLTTHSGVMGEIGIDHWKNGIDLGLQESVFREQLELAKHLNVPTTIHGLKAWDRLLQILREAGPFSSGFLLHSYSGPESLIHSFADLGAYFSCSGALLHPKREKALRLFSRVPTERLLIESDAPDQLPPADDDTRQVTDSATGERLTHPLSIRRTYGRLAEVRNTPIEEFSQTVERNFQRLFGQFVRPVQPV